jgi:hypothetical protein
LNDTPVTIGVCVSTCSAEGVGIQRCLALSQKERMEVGIPVVGRVGKVYQQSHVQCILLTFLREKLPWKCGPYTPRTGLCRA